jgi:hypothetical protein
LAWVPAPEPEPKGRPKKERALPENFCGAACGHSKRSFAR